MSAILAFLKELLAGFREWFNPQNRDLRTMQDLDRQLDKITAERDEILSRPINNADDAKKQASDLGLLAKRVVQLRRKRKAIGGR